MIHIRLGSRLGHHYHCYHQYLPYYPLYSGLRLRASSSMSSSDKEQRPRKAKIYTRTGDKGTTSTFAGRRLPKTHAIFNSLGDNDELGSSLGVALQFLHQHQDINELRTLEDRLVWIQSRLQELNSHVATPDGARAESLKFDQQGQFVAHIEAWIDLMESTLPPLKTFILPVRMLGFLTLHLSPLLFYSLEVWPRLTCILQGRYVDERNAQCII